MYRIFFRLVPLACWTKQTCYLAVEVASTCSSLKVCLSGTTALALWNKVTCWSILLHGYIDNTKNYQRKLLLRWKNIKGNVHEESVWNLLWKIIWEIKMNLLRKFLVFMIEIVQKNVQFYFHFRFIQHIETSFIKLNFWYKAKSV